ncbi:MAG: phosphatase PAP2 family protein [Chitinophagales bacterium]|nr:phosphatase PAP2 family protein [Bacteroidota bacterium]MCB9256043.1 phosphatase PAP2 family protein [Chitinophagales bacterium]
MKFKALFVLLILQLSLFAQSPYKLSYPVDVPILGVAIGTSIGGFIHEKKRSALSIDDLEGLDRSQISVFDRSATYNWNPKLAKLSDALMYGAMASPLLFLSGKESRKDFWRVGAISAEVFLLNTGITYLTKELVQRKRPYVYNPDVPLEKKLEKGATQSFFSGHTSTMASMSFSFAMMHSQYYPDSNLKPLVWFAAAVLPMAMAILRVRAGKHYWTDVMVGYGAGATIGLAVPLLHQIRKN